MDGGQHRNAAGGKSDVSMAEIQKFEDLVTKTTI
jgi:hypothetical protein